MWISIHASAKEATIFRDRNDWDTLNFNPRLREGGDYSLIYILKNINRFQSTPPRRRRPCSIISHTTCIYYFNPRLREGGDNIPDDLWNEDFKISIHASAKEATATYCDTSAIMYISSLNNFFVHYF